LHFGDEAAGATPVFFRLVRSRTPPGEPVDVIATRRPYEDPGVARVWYRIWRDPLTVVAKTHLPYRLDAARRAQWQRWFFDADFAVDELPGYAAETATNPFVTFRAIPPGTRHRFLLDEARFTIMNFIKGPVCRGAIALNVIQDRFWVFFTRPDLLDSGAYSAFLAAQDRHLRLPAAEADDSLWSLTHWRRYARAQQRYLEAKLAFIRTHRETFERGRLNILWDGEGRHRDAALSVFRHHDSATVVAGLVGRAPLTAWVIDYPILERIHYLLVAGYDVFGSAAHQALTRLYMDFLRMEAEMNFLAFLPPRTRQDQLARWYRDATGAVADFVDAYFEHDVIAPLYHYTSAAPKDELFAQLAAHVGPALGANPYALDASGLPAATLNALEGLMDVRGTPASLVPQTVFVNVPDHGALTILADSAYKNISSMFLEDTRRLPAEDALTVVNGLLGAYPDTLLEVPAADLPAL
ncbi:MAG: fatty acid cis/trans isomerase, partial [Gammaproteobacteria bacterium]